MNRISSGLVERTGPALRMSPGLLKAFDDRAREVESNANLAEHPEVDAVTRGRTATARPARRTAHSGASFWVEGAGDLARRAAEAEATVEAPRATGAAATGGADGTTGAVATRSKRRATSSVAAVALARRAGAGSVLTDSAGAIIAAGAAVVRIGFRVDAGTAAAQPSGLAGPVAAAAVPLGGGEVCAPSVAAVAPRATGLGVRRDGAVKPSS